MDKAVTAFGAQLRRWRHHRGLSQMALALLAEVSARHLSWLEGGRSMPSRAMLLRLAERLDVPLRERNAWLRAAGFAAMYAERTLADPALKPALDAVQLLLDAHVPNPALAVDRHWNLLASNRLLPMLLQGVDPALLQPPVNVLRVALHPRGLAPMIANLPQWRAHILGRLRRQAQASGDDSLSALHDELAAGSAAGDPPAAPPELVLPLRLATPFGPLNFISTVTVFGAPHDITLSELAIETFLAADGGTAQALQHWLDSQPRLHPQP
jgi:transcriptional regulator with XRE-family HTH domain